MKTYILFIFAVFALSSCTQQPVEKQQSINPIIGDISYTEKFGELPNENTDDNLRIKTHLLYVASLLKNKDVSALPLELKNKRSLVLDHLYKYATAGVFPKNYDFKNERKPCFIDSDGRICAVGFLVEQTAGRQIAEEINRKFKYDELLAMNDEAVDGWVAESGLTKEECAMIQPTYGWRDPNHITPRYGYSSSVWSGANIALATVNATQINNASGTKALPIVSLISGAGQFAMGSYVFFDETKQYGTNNESTKTLSLLNIGVGTTTMFLSTWNLLSGNTPKVKNTAYNLYSFPARNQQTGIGFSLNHRF